MRSSMSARGWLARHLGTAAAALAAIVAALLVACGGSSGGGGGGAAVTFSKSFGGTGYDEAGAAAPTADGGYVFVGGVDGHGDSGYGLDGHDLWITKLDANGDVQWQSAIGTGAPLPGAAIRVAGPTPDGGQVVAGVSRFKPATGHDLWIGKLSALGQVEWQREFDSGAWAGFAFAGAAYGDGSFANESASSVAAAPDGGYVIAGESRAALVERIASGVDRVHVDARSVVVARLDAQGRLLWQRRRTDCVVDSGSNSRPLIPVVRGISDGGAVLAYACDFGSGIRLRVVRFESDGEVQWQHDDEAFLPTDLRQTHDDDGDDGDGIANDGFVLTGVSVALGPRWFDAINRLSVVLKLGADGARQWRRFFGSGSKRVALTSIDQVCAPAAVGFACDFAVGGYQDGDHRFDPTVGYVARLSRTGSTLVERVFDPPPGIDPPAGGVDAVRGVDNGSAIAVLTGAGELGHRLVLDKQTLGTRAMSAPAYPRHDELRERLPLQVGAGRVVPDVQFASDTAVLQVVQFNVWPASLRVHTWPTLLAETFETRRPGPFTALQGEGSDTAIGVVEVAPGSFVVAGTTTMFDAPGDGGLLKSGWVLRITDGRVDWQRRIVQESETDTELHSMVAADNGNVVIAARFDADLRVIKLGPDGLVVWSTPALPGGASSSVFFGSADLRALRDGGFVVTSRAHVHRLDALGQPVWTRAYVEIEAQSIEALDDGGLVVAGSFNDYDDQAGNWSLHLRLARLDANGNATWAREVALNAAQTARAAKVRQTADGGYIVGVTEEGAIAPQAIGLEQPFGQDNVLLVKFDREGNVAWSRSYGAFLGERLNDLRVLPDGGLLVAGMSRSLGERSEAWLLRLGADGLLAAGCNAYLGSLPAAAFRTRTFALTNSDVAADSGGARPAVVSTATALTPYRPQTVTARQCFGSANPDPGPPADTRTLTVRQAGALQGVVTSTPSGIVCGAAAGGGCTAAFERGSLVTLRVDIGSVQDFRSWGPGCESISGNFGEACSVRLDADKTIDVTFAAAPPPPPPPGEFTLTVTIDRLGGFIGTTDGRIGCQVSGGQPRTCSATYAGGTVVGLYASSLPGGNVRFEAWLGDCAGFGAPTIELTMNRDHTCRALFASAS